jgi:hypothetical protein
MKRLPLLLLLVIVLLFLGGLWQLLQLRFAAGDVFPEYSSLRADPLGAKAIYESLGRLLRVGRNFRPHLQPGEGQGTTLFLLGLPSAEELFPVEDLQELENFAAAGGRVVIALRPAFTDLRDRWRSRESFTQPTNSAPSKPGRTPLRPSRRTPPANRTQPSASLGLASMADRWKFQVKHGVADLDEKGVYKPVSAARKADLPLPETLAWHTAFWFDKPDASWRLIYTREKDRAVVMERKLGAGSLVLLSDSFYFSNEAMRRDRQPELLTWLVGPNHQASFDESHLGVIEQPGVASLARRYRLHGLVLSLVVLAGLFVWRSSVSFLPPPEPEPNREQEDLVLGRESAAGFVNLLRRNLRASEVLGVCLSEWQKACARTVTPRKREQVETLIAAERVRPAREQNPPATYRDCCRVLARAEHAAPKVP